MLLGFSILAISVLLITIFFSFFQKGGFSKGFRIFTGGMIFVAVFTLIPIIIQYNLNADINEKLPLVTVLLSAIQLSTLDADYNFWVEESTKISAFYHVFCVCLCYLMPFATGGFILSFFETFLTKCKYRFLRKKRDVFYFSNLSEKNLRLANSINSERKNVLIIFCNKNDSDLSLIEKAKEEKYLVLESTEIELLHSSRHDVCFFEFYSNEDKNLSVSVDIVTRSLQFKEDYQKHITVFTLTTQSEAVEIITQLNTSFINIILIDPAIRIAYDLLYSNPLTTVLNKKNKNINALVLGTNKIAQEIIKAIIWCGQLGDEYKLSVSVIDKDASKFESQFMREYPEVTDGHYDLKFFDGDISTNELPSIIEKEILTTNYIVVASDNDEENFRTASYLRSLFIRYDIELKNKPNISVLSSNIFKQKNLKLINESTGFNFFYFGEANSIYNYKSLVKSDLEMIALNVSNSYQTKYNPNFHPSKEELIRLYYSNEKERRSNRANALHYKYRLFLMGYGIKAAEQANQAEITAQQKLIEKHNSIKKDPAFVKKFAIIEHDRWTAFNRTEGLIGTDIETVKKIKQITGNHKYPLARYHACICNWDELGELDKELGTDFQTYDSFFIDDMLEILGITNNSKINLSGLHNTIIQI